MLVVLIALRVALPIKLIKTPNIVAIKNNEINSKQENIKTQNIFTNLIREVFILLVPELSVASKSKLNGGI